MFCFMVIIEENPAQITILKRCINFKCVLQQRWKLRPIYTKIWNNRSCMIWIWNKELFSIEDPLIHLCKAL